MRDARRAWLAAAAIPVAFVAAMAVGEWLVGIAGYPAGGDRVAPLAIALLIAVPLTLAAMAPAALAVRFGGRARRAGHRSARFATALGWIAIAGWCVTFALSLIERTRP